ncbi:MAG: GNAT family N-acetyltransferase [Polyangiaceae bacterium]
MTGPRRETVQLPGGETLRELDLAAEGPRPLIDLKEAVYERKVNTSAFEWQYLKHPSRDRLRVFVVENEGHIIASTTRLPATIRLGGADCHAYFNVDSMVHPAHRRKGRMRDLYLFARTQVDDTPIFFSKGSSRQIAPLLVSIGHRAITPNTYLVSYPSAPRWLMSRLHLGPARSALDATIPDGFEDHRVIDRFGPAFDELFGRTADSFAAIFKRDAVYMNWRYVDVPHRRYLRFARFSGDKLVGVVVISIDDGQARIVDLLWDPSTIEGPSRLVRFAHTVCERNRAVRVACFATHPEVREALNRAGFYDRGETPRFSAFVPADRELAFAHASPMHVLDGDGDTEFS